MIVVDTISIPPISAHAPLVAQRGGFFYIDHFRVLKCIDFNTF